MKEKRPGYFQGKTQLIIRQCPGFKLDEGAGLLAWCWIDREGQPVGECLQGSLDELASWREQLPEDEQELPVSLMLSGDVSVCFRKVLQEKQRKHWQQVLPYLLEEQLATDIEALHIVSCTDNGGRAATAGWVACTIMEQLVECYQKAGIELQRVLPESQFLRSATDQVSIWLEGSSAFIATPDNCGQWVDSDAVELIIPGLLVDTESEEPVVDSDDLLDKPDQKVDAASAVIHCAASDRELAERLMAIATVPVHLVERETDSLFLDLLPEFYAALHRRRLLDLRTGRYKCTRRSSRYWRQWRPAAIAAGIWLGLELLFNMGSGFYFQARTESLKQENRQTYLELRPEDSRVVDVRHNLTRFLKEASTQNRNSPFLELLKTVSAVSANGTDELITPRSLDFNESNGRLSLEVRADSFESLHRYLDALKRAGLRAQMETGNQDSEGVAARLTVRSA